MPAINFSAFPYYPSLQCTRAEHDGYAQLDDADKDALLPVLSLSRTGYEDGDLEPAIHMIQQTIGRRPFLLDLCQDPPPAAFIPKDPDKELARAQKIEVETQAAEAYASLLGLLTDPRDGFAGWRGVVGRFDNCIPVLQYSDASTESLQILRQASLLSRKYECMAIRITESTEEEAHTVIPQILAVLDSPSHLLIICDCGYGRRRVEQRAEFSTRVIASIMNRIDAGQRPLLRAVCMSSSFPDLKHDGLTVLDNCDWCLWRIAAEQFPFLFGDYGAMFRRRPSATTFIPGDTRPAVVYPLDEQWIAYRHPNANDPQGWVVGANAIKDHGLYEPAPVTAGVGLIEQAANGHLVRADRSRFWLAAKVNIHLHRQIYKAAGELAELDD